MKGLLLGFLLAAASSAALAQNLACNPQAPRTDPGTGFVVAGPAEQILARGGNSGPAWEWAVDNVKGNLDWTSGVNYQWTVTYSGSGAATLQVRKQGAVVLTLSKSSGMSAGNAVQLLVSTNPSIGSSTTVSASASTINGQAVSGTISQTGNNQESTQSLYFYFPAMSQGFSASGTVTLTYATLPTGSRVDFQLRAGNVPCNNQAPTVSITSPTSGTVLQAPGAVTLDASAADSDGTVSKVDFYQDGVPVGSDTTSPYSLSLAGLPAGAYSFTAVASDDRGGLTTSAAVTVLVNAAPSASLTSPAQNAVFNAPANIPISANVADTDGTIAAVEFYHGTTLITTHTAAPYSFTWTGVPQGAYTLTARATDNNGGTVTSSAVDITVNSGVAKLHFIHADHLNTPRLIANASGATVWRWDNQEPFGDTPADETPSGLGAFEFPLGLGGWHYRDTETATWHNWYRTYVAALGRYGQADPAGLAGGLDRYSYAYDNPLYWHDRDGRMPEVNGNVTPGFTPQDYICTLGQFGGAIANDFGCIKQCCIEHDDCYSKNGCNASSWFGPKNSPCQICNYQALKCVALGPQGQCLPGCPTTFIGAP